MTDTPPVVLTGMHRSGTSLIASFLQALGVDLGDELVEADANNPRGYFEAKDVVQLNRQLLAGATLDDDGGHPDWGWTHSEVLDPEFPSELAAAAQDLVASRPASVLWGFKDPRTSVLLDFWDGILEDGRYVFLYRFPWDVADSMQRLGAEVFLNHPDYAYRIWCFYNRKLLDFQKRHPDRVVLACSNEVIAKPDAFADLLRQKLDLKLADVSLEDLVDPTRFKTLDGDDPLIFWVNRLWPEVIDVLKSLDAAADLSAADRWAIPESPVSQLAFEGPVDVSVVTPCHNDGEFLIEAVASVERSLRRTSNELRCWQIVVNDGSSEPRTLEVLDHLREVGVEVLDLENGGLSHARNYAVQRARGRYILPLDADNRLRPGLLEDAVRYLDEHELYAVVYGDCQEFGLRNGRRTTPELDFDTLLRGNFIDACTLIRKSVVIEQGGYDEGLSAWEDWDLWIRFVRGGWKFARSERITFDYRVRPSSMLGKLEKDPARGDLMLQILTKHHECYQELLTRTAGHLVGSWPSLLESSHHRELQRRSDLEASYRRLERYNVTLRKKLSHAEGSYADLESYVATLRKKSAHGERLESSYAELESYVATLRKKSAYGEQLESSYAELESHVATLRKKSAYGEELESSYAELESHVATLREKSAYGERLESSYAELEGHVETLRKKAAHAEELESSYSELAEQIAALEKKSSYLAGLEQSYSELEQFARSLQETPKLQQQELARLGQSRLVRLAISISRNARRLRAGLTGWLRALFGRRQPSGS